MDQSELRPQIRVAMHVHAYLWIGLTLVSTIPFLYFSAKINGGERSPASLAAAVAMIVAFQLVFWFARSYCTVPERSAWDSLLLVAAYMSVGIGNLYSLVAIVAVALAAVGMVVIALYSLINGGKPAATRRLGNLVAWFYRHRMYQ